MYIRWKNWVQFLMIGLGIFAFAYAANADTTYVADPTISSVTVDSWSGTTKGGSGTVQITFVTSAKIASGYGFSVYGETTDCNIDWENCQTDFSTATVTFAGATGTKETNEPGDYTLRYTVSKDLAAGKYTLTLTGVTNMNYDGGVRIWMQSSASDYSAYESYEDWRSGTTHNSAPTKIGTILAYGKITTSAGAVATPYCDVYDEADWDPSRGLSTDHLGYFAVSNPGFASGATVNYNCYPDSGSGLFQTTGKFTYAGSPVENNITMTAATKSISGTVSYSDNSTGVSTANVYIYGDGVWSDDDTDASGNYSMLVGGGNYEVCLSNQWDEEGNKVEADWFYNGGCSQVSFSSDSSAETSDVDFEVGRTDATIKGQFTKPDGSSAFSDRGWISFYSEEDWFGGDVNTDGSFSIHVVGGNGVSATSRSARSVDSVEYKADLWFYSEADRKYYWEPTTVEVSYGETKNLGTVTLGERDVTYVGTVQDSEGNPLENIYVDAWLQKGGWTGSPTNAAGQATLYLYEPDDVTDEWESRPSTGDSPDYVYQGEGDRFAVVSGNSYSHTFTLTPTTLTVTVSFVDSSGATVTSVNGNVWCWEEGSPNGFGSWIQNGQGSFGAVAMEGYCDLWVDSSTYMSSSELEVEFVDGEDQSLQFVLVERNAEVEVFVKANASSNASISATAEELVTDADGWVYAWSDETGTWINERLGEEGSTTLRLAGGADGKTIKYNLGVWFDEDEDYISTHGSETTVELAENDSQQKTLTVFGIDAEITGSAVDTSGDVLPNIWVWCGNWSELDDKVFADLDGYGLIENGFQTGSDGSGTGGFVSGHEYECWASAPPELGYISPEGVTVDLTQQTSAEVEFKFVEATATIAGSASIASGASATTATDDIEDLWCGGWSDNGYSTWSDSFGGSEYELGVVPDTWHVWCGTEIYNEDEGTYEFYEVDQDYTVLVEADGDTKTQNVELGQSLWNIPASTSVTFDSTQAYTLVLEDGTTIEFPANALATSGDVNVTAEPETRAARSVDIPFGFPWNLEAYQDTIIGEFNSSVTMKVPYDAAILEELGLEPEDLYPKKYDSESGAWVAVDNVSHSDGFITFTMTSFSEVGLTYNVRGVTEQPQTIKEKTMNVKNVKKHSATLTWKDSQNSGVTKYTVQVRKCKNEKSKECTKNKHYVKKKQWKKYNSVKPQSEKTTKKKVAKKLKQGTYHQWRVSACAGADNCGDFSAWNRFKTKGL